MTCETDMLNSLPLSFMTLADEAQAEALESRGTFTTMTQDGTKHWATRQVALLVADDEDGRRIIELGLVTRSHTRVATGWHRLRYVRKEVLTPIDVDALVAAVPTRFRATVDGRAAREGVLTTKSAAAVTEALLKLQPDAEQALKRLLRAESRATPRLRGDALQSAVQEADAVRLAIDIAGIPRTSLHDVRPDGEVPFLERLEAVRASEDPTVAYDSMRFLDFERLDHPSGAVRFTKGNERLTVINVNRQPLERTTGADLIYINETRASFVLVQYKSFRNEESNGASRLVYRPDAQLAAELERMHKIKPGKRDGTLGTYRLHRGCCYLKICKPVVRVDHPADELVTGMYLPLDYYDELVASDDVKGPRDGVALSYATVSRYLNNDLFVQLVRGAWIGSRGATTKRLTGIALAGLSADRSVTIASASVEAPTV